MNTKNKVNNNSTKDKLLFFILCALALFFSFGTHFALINSNIMHYIFKSFTPVAFFIFPILSVCVIIVASVFVFKKNKISYVIPVAISLVGCFLAFSLADSSFSSKIQSDYLKNEKYFNEVIDNLENNELKDGIYDLDKKELNFVIPEKKFIVASVGNNKNAYFFIALDIEDRYEGYVYDPYGSPEEWLENGEFSEPLDIEKKWSYFVYHKGVSYD